MSLLDALTSSGKTQLYIGGEWREADDGRTMEVLDPSTAESLVSVSSGAEDDARAAVDAASASQPAWAATSPAERSTISDPSVPAHD